MGINPLKKENVMPLIMSTYFMKKNRVSDLPNAIIPISIKNTANNRVIAPENSHPTDVKRSPGKTISIENDKKA